MTLGKRLLFYFGGFGIGMILLLFFLGGKRASCEYLPNARTLKDIRNKTRIIPDDVLKTLEENKLDTSIIGYLLTQGEVVNFRTLDRSLDSCRIYIIEGKYDTLDLRLKVENCEKEARVTTLEFTP